MKNFIVKLILKVTGVILLLASAFLIADDEECCQDFPNSRFILRHNEGKGIGFKDGYTTLGAFLSPDFCSSNLYPFVDARWHFFNHGKNAANIGIGGRYLLDNFDALVGSNIYYDYRQTRHKSFHQVGVGLEYLSTCFDARINGYIPVGKTTSHHFDTTTRQTCDPTFTGFGPNSVLIQGLTIDRRRKVEYSFGGLDAEIGSYLWSSPCYNLYAAIGPYFYSGKHRKNLYGGSLRFCAGLTDYVSLEVQGNYDNVFKGTVNVFVAINIPFDFYNEPSSSSYCCPTLRQKLVQPVQRNEIIPTKRHHEQTITSQTNISAIDPATGQALHFIFVNNTNPSPGNGTFSDPFNTLAAAEVASVPGDQIYVFQGDGTSNGMNEGFVLQNNQGIFGSGTSFLLPSQCGIVQVPILTPGLPVVTNIAGNGFDLANNNTVQGFHISAPLLAGINGQGVSNALITNNLVTNPGNSFGISFENSEGTLNIVQNTVSTTLPPLPLNAGINVQNNGATSSVANIAQNNIQHFNTGIQVFSFGTSSITSTISNNIISNSHSAGIDANAFGTSNSVTTIMGNQVSNIATNGIISFCHGTLRSIIDSNIVTGCGLEGIVIATGNGGLQNAVANNNLLIGNGGTAGLLAETSFTSPPGDLLCLRLTNNTSDTGYFIHNFIGSLTTLNLEPTVGNIGTITTLGPITNVPDCTCGFCN